MKILSRVCFMVLCFVIFPPLHLIAKPSAFENETAEKKGRVAGKVRDAELARPLSDASIVVVGTLFGANAGFDGSYQLRLPEGEWILEARFLGYATSRQPVKVIADSTTQMDLSLRSTTIELPQTVVTGTRGEKTAEASPVQTKVVTTSEIRRAGSTDLRDVLAEQTGLNIVHDFSGKGIQIQGFDPDYTLILIDGSPIIGRVAGTLELTRFAVGNLDRVEVVKGPNSSLYGSEALAGVVNLITRVPRAPFKINLSGKTGELASQDFSAQLETRRERLGAYFFYNQKSRDHFDLDPQTVDWTAPAYSDHTFSSKLLWRLNEQAEVTLNSRWYRENLTGRVGLTVDSVEVRSDDLSKVTDWNFSPSLEWRITPTQKLSGKVYLSRYVASTRLQEEGSGRIFDSGIFDQRYQQVEAQYDAVLSSKHLLKLGGGAIYESVDADRISRGEHTTRNYVAFAQHEWIPHAAFDVVASARLDAHSEYDTHFSPKLATLWRFHDDYSLRFSVGSGFKAPTFSQLYLDFVNPQVGYSVFGSTNVIESLQRLEELGEIRQIIIDPSTIERLRPETSWSYNFSVESKPLGFLDLRANVFRNDVSNLIEAQAIARKTNNQSVFSYFNLRRVFTQGVETEARLNVVKNFEMALGYQFVVAKDKDVIDQLERGEIKKTGTSGRIRSVEPEEYSGLFSRSRNSGTVRLTYKTASGFALNARSIIRGKFGLFDVNGNGILDDESEYAAPYALLNVHLAMSIKKNFEISVGAENLLDYLDARSLAGLPGRVIYAKLGIDWQKQSSSGYE